MVRILLAPYSHVVFSVTTGAALGIAMHAGGPILQHGVVIAWAVGVSMHMSWNITCMNSQVASLCMATLGHWSILLFMFLAVSRQTVNN